MKDEEPEEEEEPQDKYADLDLDELDELEEVSITNCNCSRKCADFKLIHILTLRIG